MFHKLRESYQQLDRVQWSSLQFSSRPMSNPLLSNIFWVFG